MCRICLPRRKFHPNGSEREISTTLVTVVITCVKKKSTTLVYEREPDARFQVQVQNVHKTKNATSQAQVGRDASRETRILPTSFGAWDHERGEYHRVRTSRRSSKRRNGCV